MSMRICNAEKSGFLDARAVSGIVNAYIQYRWIATRLSERGGRTCQGRFSLTSVLPEEDVGALVR